MTGLIKPYLKGLVSLLYPHYCAACGNVLFNNEKTLCLTCLADLPRTRFHENPENEVARIFWGRVPLEHVTSFMYFTRDSRYRQILHEIKYHGQKDTGYEMGKLFGLELKETPFQKADLIHPVPLHKSKMRKRGYNQSELIARGISDMLNVPVRCDLIERISPTPTQTKKARYERWENVRDTFSITASSDLINKHLLLIDDVITTGATIEACAEKLLEVEGVTVSAATLACVKLQ